MDSKIIRLSSLGMCCASKLIYLQSSLTGSAVGKLGFREKSNRRPYRELSLVRCQGNIHHSYFIMQAACYGTCVVAWLELDDTGYEEKTIVFNTLGMSVGNSISIITHIVISTLKHISVLKGSKILFNIYSNMNDDPQDTDLDHDTYYVPT